MASQDAAHDANKWPALIAHTGTAGTAETVRVVASGDGALRVDLVSGDTINIGTMTVGTIDMLKAGTLDTVKAGTLNTLGTVANINNGTIRVTVGTIAAGTVRVSVGTVAAGTINTGTVNTGTINTGTIDLLKAGTITKLEGGSIAVTAGTIYGTVTNVEEDYAIRVDEEASGTTYYGYALPINGGSPAEAVWKILRKTYDATASTYTFADNNKNFDNVWDNRTALSY